MIRKLFLLGISFSCEIFFVNLIDNLNMIEVFKWRPYFFILVCGLLIYIYAEYLNPYDKDRDLT